MYLIRSTSSAATKTLNCVKPRARTHRKSRQTLQPDWAATEQTTNDRRKLTSNNSGITTSTAATTMMIKILVWLVYTSANKNQLQRKGHICAILASVSLARSTRFPFLLPLSLSLYLVGNENKRETASKNYHHNFSHRCHWSTRNYTVKR